MFASEISVGQRSNETWIFEQSAPEEGIRLMVAFLQIDDPAARLRLIEMAEEAAQKAPRDDARESSNLQDNLR